MSYFFGYEFRKRCVTFIRSLSGQTRKGFFRYSRTGDLFGESIHWGLGNAVFATKSLYMLRALTEDDRIEIGEFIGLFQGKDGSISDPVVRKQSRYNRWIYSVRNFDFNNFANKQTIRAETRQSFAALHCLGKKPEVPFFVVKADKTSVREYVHSLDWSRPWGAASHISHLVFFLHNNRLLFGMHREVADELIKSVFDAVDEFRRCDGAWYGEEAHLPLTHKVNAAMKIMTAYAVIGKIDFDSPEKLIDLSLASANIGDACNNFNIICVLYYCFQKTNYRSAEIEQYCVKKLEIYKKHYWPEFGGFSFYERHANDVYYGARISRGLQEPDIHGTMLFLWGITLISKILNGLSDCKYQVPIT